MIDLNSAFNLIDSVTISLFSDKTRFWADDTKTFGSQLYKLKQNRLDRQTLNLAKSYAENCLSWLIDDGLANEITVETRNVDDTKLKIIVKIKSANITYNREYVSIWL